MSTQRVFGVRDHLQPDDGEPIRSVGHAAEDAAVVAWAVEPGQRVSPHAHLSGQDETNRSEVAMSLSAADT